VQNMMCRHTVAVYDRDRELVKTIPDDVDLSGFGHRRYEGMVRGAPVEAAFSADGRHAYVSNYSMYGPGFSRPGDDVCSPSSGYDESFVYRIDVETLQIDQAIAVGSVPKYVATTPDGRYVLVSNWCSYSLSVVSVQKGREVRRVPLGPYPRGIIVSPDSRTAYVAVMGTTGVAYLHAIEESTRLDLVHVPEAMELDALRWLRRHDERRFSFVDATSFAVMRSMKIKDALAFDGDFSAAGFRELRA